MTDQQINAAIAEACGWKAVCVDGDSGFYKGFDNGAELRPDLPDYCGDLNAMHSAEKVMPDESWLEYTNMVRKIFGPMRSVPAWGKSYLHLTARQRAEAFLRTLEKWEEVQND